MRNLPSLWRQWPEFSVSESPFRPMSRMMVDLQREIDNLFEDFMSPTLTGREITDVGRPIFTPSCDIDETDTHFVMSFDLPGVKKDDIKIEYRDNELTVSGKRQEERESKTATRSRKERFYGTFERSFTLPASVKPEQIETHFSDGVLRIALPKAEAKKALEIKIGEGKAGFWEKLLPHKKEETPKAA